MNYEKSYKDFQDLKEKQDFLRKKVNYKVEAMFDKVQKEYKTLMARKHEIELNKTTLNSDMVELDQKRIVTLINLGCNPIMLQHCKCQHRKDFQDSIT